MPNMRTMLTDNVAALVPFNTQEILVPGGIYYGEPVVRSIKQVAESIVESQYNGNVDLAPEYIQGIYNS